MPNHWSSNPNCTTTAKLPPHAPLGSAAIRDQRGSATGSQAHREGAQQRATPSATHAGRHHPDVIPHNPGWSNGNGPWMWFHTILGETLAAKRLGVSARGRLVPGQPTTKMTSPGAAKSQRPVTRQNSRPSIAHHRRQATSETKGRRRGHTRPSTRARSE